MILVELLEFVLVGGLLLFTFTQVVVPLFRGTKLFPFLRRETRLNQELVEAQQRLHEARLQETLEKTRRAVEGQPKNKGDDQGAKAT